MLIHAVIRHEKMVTRPHVQHRVNDAQKSRQLPEG